MSPRTRQAARGVGRGTPRACAWASPGHERANTTEEPSLQDTSQETTPRYDLRAERDACGIGFVADVRGRPSRDMIETAIHSLCRRARA